MEWIRARRICRFTSSEFCHFGSEWREAERVCPSPYDGDLSLDFPKANSRVRGGILADSMGMGKTWYVADMSLRMLRLMLLY